MDARSIGSSTSMPLPQRAAPQPPSSLLPSATADPTGKDAAALNAITEPSELRDAFTQFVGQTMFGTMLSSMRKTVGTPAYMHGGRTEEVFQQQMDQYIVEDLTKTSADTIADPMFELFNLQRRS
ncbi:hypothetical protein K227x_46110 [Rubripirellula lacrimiformis]|uniref:Flagellar protein FlgJ N-terminal domain-containing protein n=1 Tax=Rubripirellula lacrimiformis TaxID=1930273 RepID=A0A517NGK5_9BACT|nr:rod-binding protein [Rubripirellula lacrimiformis]QDT06203.1 hypothetical protein K227x_46110 [Rubripirellula lacrimiformis]